jgi:chemotaxis family two-component system response regulator Rcp1
MWATGKTDVSWERVRLFFLWRFFATLWAKYAWV